MLRELGEPMFLLPHNPTAENIAKLIFDAATAARFPDRIGQTVGDAPLLCHLRRAVWLSRRAESRASRRNKIVRVARSWGHTPDYRFPPGIVGLRRNVLFHCPDNAQIYRPPADRGLWQSFSSFPLLTPDRSRISWRSRASRATGRSSRDSCPHKQGRVAGELIGL